jgi:hypothetical protein
MLSRPGGLLCVRQIRRKVEAGSRRAETKSQPPDMCSPGRRLFKPSPQQGLKNTATHMIGQCAPGGNVVAACLAELSREGAEHDPLGPGTPAQVLSLVHKSRVPVGSQAGRVALID